MLIVKKPTWIEYFAAHLGDEFELAEGDLLALANAYEQEGAAATAVSGHESAYDHSNIHVPGSDDQDLSGYALTTHDHDLDYDALGAASGAVGTHESTYTHSDIAHTNRTALDAVSGTNTGDQDLSGYSLTSHLHTGVYDPAGTASSAVSGHESTYQHLSIIPIITGSGAPSAGTGLDGQYYYDGTNGLIYGPKAAGAWPAGVRLRDNVNQGTATGQILYWDGSKWAASTATDIAVSGKKILLASNLGRLSNVAEDTYFEFNANKYIVVAGANAFGLNIAAASGKDLTLYGANNGAAGNGLIIKAYNGTAIKEIFAVRHVASGESFSELFNKIRIWNTASIFQENRIDTNGDITVFQTGDEILYSGNSSTQERTIWSIKRTMPVATDASRTSQVDVSYYSFNGAKIGKRTTNDGTNLVQQFGDITGGNYTEIENDGTVEFVGNATVWEDLNFDPDSGGGPAATLPDYVTINNTIHREFTSANNQLCGSVKELPHAYKLSSTIYPHVHLFLKSGESSGTTGATFTIYWELRQASGVTSGSVPLASTSAELTNNTTKWTVNDATGFTGSAELGAQLALTIARTGGNAGDVVVLTYGVHYEIDTVGSRQITTK